MGRDKALMALGHRRLVEIAADAAATAGAHHIFTVGGDESALTRLGYEWLPDRWPGEGPLGGIVTALTATTSDRVLVLACDHVAAEPAAIRAVIDALGVGEADVALPVVGGRDQTLHAAWHRRCLDHLAARFADGARSVHEGLTGLDVVRIGLGDDRWVADADTPAQLLAAHPKRYHRRSAEEIPVTVTEIDVDTLEELDPTEIQLIDVREADEFEEARVRGTIHIPLGTVPDAVEALDRTRTVYVICASGGRSMRAAEFLTDAGFEAVNVAGGTKGWIASGRPVDSGPATA
jgi:molybdopterin-guanine dinucleotide biosynthesis protein A/rhodanese-related sulfurtransferase